MLGLLYNTEAIVIRSIAYGETHAIVTLLTPAGILSAMARGAKKPQSRLAAGVQLCAEGIYAVYQGRGMGNIQQVEVLNTRRGLRERLDLAAYAAYFCELVQNASEPYPHGSQAVFELFRGALDWLSAPDADASMAARIWEAKVIRIVGASPDWMSCVRCGGILEQNVTYSSVDGGFLCQGCRALVTGEHGLFRVPDATPRVLQTMATVPWRRIREVRLSRSALEAINRILRNQMTDFAGFSLKSRNVLDSLGYE